MHGMQIGVTGYENDLILCCILEGVHDPPPTTPLSIWFAKTLKYAYQRYIKKIYSRLNFKKNKNGSKFEILNVH